MISTLRSQVGFAAAVAHARLRLSRLELIGGSGRTAGRYASAARAFISPTAFEQARGGALGAGVLSTIHSTEYVDHCIGGTLLIRDPNPFPHR